MNAKHPGAPAVAVLAGTACAVVVLVVSSLRYPAIIRLPDADVIVALTAVMLVAYVACAGWTLGRPSAGQRIGLVLGAVGGAMWSAEIWCGGPAKLSHAAEQATGATFVLLAVTATVTAGILAGSRIPGRGAPWRAGLYAGLVSGVVVYSFAVIMTMSTLPILASRSDYRAQFAHSGAPTIDTFLVGDILAAAAAHLVINAVLGLAGGCLGALIARRKSRAAVTA